MSNKNLNVSQPVREFIKELNGRYRSYVSDEFLEHLLIYEIEIGFFRLKETKPNRAIEMSTLAYMIAYPIFEAILEHRCNAGGNGHHVAQNLASKFV